MEISKSRNSLFYNLVQLERLIAEGCCNQRELVAYESRRVLIRIASLGLG